MANIPLQSISFPGLVDKYITPTVDNTLTQAGAAADAKKTGDEISGLKNDLSELKDNVNSAYIVDTATGAVASFTDGADDVPVKDLTVAIEPVQSGSGDPSPENVRHISGWTGANVTRTGKNIMLPEKYQQSATIVVLGQSNATDYGLTLKAGTYSISVTSTKFGSFYYRASTGSSNILIANGYTGTFTLSEQTNLRIWYYVGGDGVSVSDISNVQLETGSSVTAYAQYDADTYSVNWQIEAGTVYGGTLDVTTGVLTVDRGYIASYNGETLPSTWISDRDVYASGTTPTTGAQVVYTLASPQTYQLTPQEVSTVLGQNNIFADTGNVTVQYRADTKLYIDKVLSQA